MANENDKDKSQGPAIKTSRKRVRVLRDNVGPKLYMKGQITDDADVVALLDHPHKHTLVEEV